jgi:hypothetical protein
MINKYQIYKSYDNINKVFFEYALISSISDNEKSFHELKSECHEGRTVHPATEGEPGISL